MNTIKAYYIDPANDIAEVREITDTLDTYYEMLHCDTIDIVNRGFGRTGKTRFEIVCDDEGLFKERPFVTAIDEHMNPMLVGSLLVAGLSDDEGNLTSLTDEDVRLLERFTMRLSTTTHRTPYPLLTYMTY